MALTQKLRTLGWFLRRPALYRELARELKTEIVRPFAYEGDSGAQQWCVERAMAVGEAIERLTGSGMSYVVERRFGEVFAAARERAMRARSAEPSDMPPAGAADVQLLYWLAERMQAERAVETGVAYGWSSLGLLLSLSNRPSARLTSTDMPLPRTTGAYVGCVVPNDLRAQWTLLRGLDRQLLPRALDDLGRIDICHYDSDKSYEGRRWAYRLLWSALRPGGRLISDDIGDNLAFQEFAGELEVEPVVVRTPAGSATKYAGVLTKNA
jgi:predicted O-methyltransferase YrrM